jgi:hypothetical protein
MSDKMPIRVVLKDGNVVEYDPAFVSRIELDINQRTWWVDTARPLWWLGGQESVQLCSISGQSNRQGVVLPSNNNTWLVTDLDNGYQTTTTDHPETPGEPKEIQ